MVCFYSIFICFKIFFISLKNNLMEGNYLQYCDGFFHTPIWICHRYTRITSIPNCPRTTHHTLCLQVVTEYQLWEPCFIHQNCTGYLFYIWQCMCCNAILSNHPTSSTFHWFQMSVLMSVSPLLPWLIRWSTGCSVVCCLIFTYMRILFF